MKYVKINADMEMDDNKYISKSILDFINDNKKAIEEDNMDRARVKFFGPSRNSKFLSISLKTLEKIAKMLK